MVVKVVPLRAIPGILTKNKWIDEEMELDLNRKEIIYCMGFGNVYYEDKLISNIASLNSIYLQKEITKVEITKTLEEVISKPETPILFEEPVGAPVQEVVNEENPFTKLDETELVIIPDAKIDYTLTIVSTEKENNHIILTTQFNTQYGKIGGNMYGLFNIIGGNRPATLEYKVEDSWVKINNKFASLDVIEDGQKFTFRLLPKNNNLIKFRIVIKDTQNQEELVKLEDEIDPSKL